ncbi:MAG: hypothetical protein QOD52_1471, partial [Gaiellaceae bacterium]|nr:hypothetical protein [Gaiellaceae bacterium]
PAYAAFQLPVAQISGSALWGQLRAPSAGSTARIERHVGSRWQTLATVYASAGGYFRWSGKLTRGMQVRLHAGLLVGPALSID